MGGLVEEATELFERLLSLRNDLGLLAEQYDPRSRRQLGNFPQAFSHVGIVNTAHNLTSAEGPAAQRADRAKRSEEHTSDLQSLMRIPYAGFCLKNTPQTVSLMHMTSYSS